MKKRNNALLILLVLFVLAIYMNIPKTVMNTSYFAVQPATSEVILSNSSVGVSNNSKCVGFNSYSLDVIVPANGSEVIGHVNNLKEAIKLCSDNNFIDTEYYVNNSEANTFNSNEAFACYSDYLANGPIQYDYSLVGNSYPNFECSKNNNIPIYFDGNSDIIGYATNDVSAKQICSNYCGTTASLFIDANITSSTGFICAGLGLICNGNSYG